MKNIFTKICIVCDKEFIKTETCSRKEWNNRRFCSKLCCDKNKKGKPAWNKGLTKQTDERVKRNGLSLKGRKFPGRKSSSTWKKGNIPWNKGTRGICKAWNKGLPKEQQPSYGKKRTDETKKKIGDSHRGDKCYMWKGGKTKLTDVIKNLQEYKNWRKEVFERNSYQCQKCGITGGKLHPHHKNPFSKILTDNKITTLEEAINCKELWDINNGQTLCIPCHKQTSSYLRNQAS